MDPQTHNELIKSRASVLNGLCTAVVSIGVIAPVAALAYGSLPSSALVADVYKFAATFFGIGLALHALAELVLTELVP
jgi:uncharacterized integral membrane protein